MYFKHLTCHVSHSLQDIWHCSTFSIEEPVIVSENGLKIIYKIEISILMEYNIWPKTHDIKFTFRSK